MHDDKEGVIPGNALVVDPKKQFRPLSKYGNAVSVQVEQAKCEFDLLFFLHSSLTDFNVQPSHRLF